MPQTITPDLPEPGNGWLILGEPRTLAAAITSNTQLLLHLGNISERWLTPTPVLSLPPSRIEPGEPDDITCWDLTIEQVEQVAAGQNNIPVWITTEGVSVLAGTLSIAQQGTPNDTNRTMLTVARIVVGPTGNAGPPNVLAIGTVTTGAPDSAAAASITGTAPSQVLNLTIPRGAEAAYELRGAGMPNGVVTASPGTYYTDTAGTCGAWRWLKKSGTGNTGWECIVGDTGWRVVTSLLVNTPEVKAGSLQIRRVNETVTIRSVSLEFQTDYTIGEYHMFATPFGFAFGPIAGRFSRANGLASTVLVSATSAGALHLSRREMGTPANIWPSDNWPLAGSISGIAAQAWPTTLPGTPV